MRYVFIFSLLMTGCSFVPGGKVIAGSGVIETEEVDVDGNFYAVEASGGIHVEVFSDDRETIIIEGDDNLVEHVDVRREGETIFVDYDRTLNPIPTRPVVVSVTTARINSIHVSGGGEVYAAPMRTKELFVHSSGGSKVDIERLEAETLEVHISGGGNMDIKGDIDQQFVHLSGGSHYRAFNLEGDDAELDLSGGSWAKVSAEDDLDVHASGGSQVWWRGDARVQSKLSGGSGVHRGRD